MDLKDIYVLCWVIKTESFKLSVFDIKTLYFIHVAEYTVTIEKIHLIIGFGEAVPLTNCLTIISDKNPAATHTGATTFVCGSRRRCS